MVWVIVVNLPQRVRHTNNTIVLHKIIIAMGLFLGSVSGLRSMNGTLTKHKPIKIGATIKDGTQRFSKA